MRDGAFRRCPAPLGVSVGFWGVCRARRTPFEPRRLYQGFEFRTGGGHSEGRRQQHSCEAKQPALEHHDGTD
eukprot:3299692-Pleurochrysis_carterae.AAC.1